MRKLLVLLAILTLAAPLMFYGCSGDDGSTGATGPQGDQGPPGPPGQDLVAVAVPENCQICHAGVGDTHQYYYDQLYQDNVIRVTNLAYNFGEGNNDVVTFNMSKAGADFDCTKVYNLNIYFAPYDNTNDRFEFNPPIEAERLSIKGTLTAGANGLCTSTNPSADNVSLTTKNGYIVVYGYDGLVGTIPNSRVRQVQFPYAQLLKTGTVPYVSAANASGCEKCHTIPYLKHGNIYAQVNHDPATDFITCKACHIDNNEGGHQFWQELVDDPELAARDWNGTLTDADKATIAAKYSYETRLMNDVHMSHAMEFEYPTSMATCNMCHAGKLGQILTDANFKLETCRSCHPVSSANQNQNQKDIPALQDIAPASLHGSMDFYNNATNCNGCHSVGSPIPAAPVFSKIHTGYYDLIYTDNGVKYSSQIKVTIDNASYNDNSYLLSFGFSATGTAGGLNATSITPTVLVGLYGYDSKDYVVGPHERSIDSSRDLEYTYGTTANPRITLTSAGSGKWNATADLSHWAGIIDNGAVRRVEIAVMPRLNNSEDEAVALDAPSRTYSLVANAFVADYFEGKNDIAKATNCNNCHDALATTFHTADRGGNIVVCRLCHITKSGGSHLEMQSRSIDSYAHAIHSFQAFDIQNYNFDNAVSSMYYDLKIESHFPTFGVTNCVACHAAGKFNVPDQSKSLPGLLSASRDTLKGWNRMIFGFPTYATGPGSRACGACHRAEMIKEDAAVELSAFNSHTDKGGYMLEPGTIPTWQGAVNKVVSDYYDGILVVLP